jgi:hypothetical protein
MAKRGKAKERANGGESRVSCARAIAVRAFALIEKGTDRGGIKLGEIKTRGRDGEA